MRTHIKNNTLIGMLSIILLLGFGIFETAVAKESTLLEQWIQRSKQTVTPEFEKVKEVHKKRVEILIQRLEAAMPEDDRQKVGEVEVFIVDDPMLNAGMLDKKMFVCRGLLEVVKSRDQIALIIAHELSHAALGHYEKTIASNMAALAAGVGTSLAAKKITAHNVSSPAGQAVAGVITGIAVQTVAEMVKSYFSLKMEAQADRKGMSYAYGAGFNIREAMKVWVFFASFLEHETGWDYIRMHAPSPERILEMEKTFAEMLEKGPEPLAPGIVMEKPLSRLMENAELLNAEKTLDDFYSSRPVYYEKLINELPIKDEREDRFWYDNRMQNMRKEAFGVEEIGLSGKGKRRGDGNHPDYFPLSSGKIDWSVNYKFGSISTIRGSANDPVRYTAQWYSPDGNLFKDQSFASPVGRWDFGKTTLEWDPELGNYVTGKWMLRVYEKGYLLDERTFEIVREN